MSDAPPARPRVHARARRGRSGDPRLDVARAEDPRRQRRLDEPQAVGRSTRTTRREAVDVARRRAATRRRRRAPGRPRRRALPRAGRRSTTTCARELAALRRARAAAQRRRRSRRSTRRGERCPAFRTSPSSTRPSTRRSRTRRRPTPLPRALARGVGHPPLRLPRALGRVGGRAACRVAAPRRLPPRRRLLGDRGARRPLGRHDDGLQPARGRADGDALRLDRRRDRCSTCCGTGTLDGRGARARARASSPGLLGLSGELGPGRGARALGRARGAARARRLRAPGRRRGRARWPSSLGGLDALVFTAGIGEGSAQRPRGRLRAARLPRRRSSTPS